MVKRKRNNRLVVPFVKWVGGKRQLLSELERFFPKKISKYYEPFIGGGAVLFHIQPKEAIINDSNGELINLYKVIKYKPEELIEDLKKHENKPDYFYNIRSLDRNQAVYSALTDIERASRIIYLNKTCYNGLFRVNGSGEFNSPFGRYKNPNIVNETTIRAVSNYLSKNSIEILNTDYEKSLSDTKEGDFVYLDPPYDPVSESANFTGYTKNGFDKSEQIRLKNVCDEFDSLGIKWILSNSDVKGADTKNNFFYNLFGSYRINRVLATRSINSNSANQIKLIA